MGIRNTIREKLYDWGERLDVAAGAPPRPTNRDLAAAELGNIMLSPSVIERVDNDLAYYQALGDLVLDDPEL